MKLLADKICYVKDKNDALTSIASLLNEDTVGVVSFINAHAYTLAEHSAEFKTCLLNASLLFRDGIGSKILLKLYKKDPGYNANGTDLIQLTLEYFKDKTFCFIGTESPYIETAVATCRANNAQVVSHLDGFQSFDAMFKLVSESAPNILILGMGMPKQEKFSAYMQENYKGSILIINGGAIFDFIAQRFKRAPDIFRKYEIEWIYRLLNEPVRLFQRYVIGIPQFFWQVSRNLLKEKKENK